MTDDKITITRELDGSITFMFEETKDGITEYSLKEVPASCLHDLLDEIFKNKKFL